MVVKKNFPEKSAPLVFRNYQHLASYIKPEIGNEQLQRKTANRQAEESTDRQMDRQG